MKKNNRWARIFLIVVACFSILSLSLSNLAVYGGQIYAEEATPTPTVEASLPTSPQDSLSPTESVTPTPTAEITPTSKPTVEPSPTLTPLAEVEILPSPSATAENLSLPESTQPSPTPTLSQTDSSPPTSSKGSLSIVILSDVSAQSIELNLDSQNEAGSASLTTDKADYAPTDTVVISGTEFLFDTRYTLIISSSDTPAVNFQTEATTNDQGKFIYAYQLDGNYRPNYKVEIKDSEGKVLATVAFTDSDAIFSDGFESDNFSNWSSVDAPKWEIINGSVGGGTTHEGTKRAQVKGNTNGNDVLLKNQSTSGYQNLSLTYWYKIKENLEAGDHVLVQWSTDGSTWNDLADYFSLSNGEWTQATFNLPAGANNQSEFSFRFQATLNAGNDEFELDDISLTGDPADTGTITIDKVVEGGDVPSSNWSFNILGDEGTVASDLHDEDSVTLPVGTYSISESTIAGYTLTAVGGVCSDINSPNATLTVTTDGGTCTITNTQDSDTTVPTVLNVSATDANGTYYTNETVHVTVQFSEPVTVTPYYWFTCTFWGFCPDHYEYPKLQLQLDGQTRWLAYTSGSDTDTLQFDYVVADGDHADALNYVDAASLIYNSRDTSQVTIRDTAGNAADITLPAIGSAESLDGQKDIAINVTSTARLRAFKYFDVDQNGIYDGDDYPLEGWRISLYNDRGFTYIDDRVTGADGYTDYWENVPVEDPNELVLQEDPSVQWVGEGWETRDGYEDWLAINPADRGGGGSGTYWDGEVNVEAGGEHTFSFGNWYPSDTTPPTVQSAETIDNDDNGNIDGIRLTFSEDIDDSRLNIGEADGWDIEDPVGGEQIDVGDSSNELILYFGEGPNPDTGNTASFTYTPTGGLFSTHDLDGNELESYEGVAADGASPVLLSAFTRDTNANGKIDAIELTFSEDIDDNMLDTSSADGWDVWGYDGEIIGTGEGDSDNRLLLTFDEGVSADTGSRPLISYSPSEELTSTHDLAGNELAYYEDFASDGAAPVSVINSPETNNIYNSPIDISGQSSDASGDTVSYVNLFYRDNPESEWNEIPDSQQNNEGGEPFEWLYEWTPPSDGTYDIKVEATDDSGNIELSPVVAGIVYDTSAPETPLADPVAGDYDSDQTVKLSSNDDLSDLDKIYYTTDGSAPDGTKTEYTVEITVDKDLVIKAIAYDKAGNSSGILTASYGIAPKISGEGSSLVTTSSATITWTTDDPATSRVVYDTVFRLVLGAAPDYGYANSTTEADSSPKVTSHSVTINGLLAGTTYYYRTVSHGSPEAVGGEKSFKTSTASTPASTTTSTTTSTNGGGGVGDGLSDGLGCGSNDCSGGSAGATSTSLGGLDRVI